MKLVTNHNVCRQNSLSICYQEHLIVNYNSGIWVLFDRVILFYSCFQLPKLELISMNCHRYCKGKGRIGNPRLSCFHIQGRRCLNQHFFLVFSYLVTLFLVLKRKTMYGIFAILKLIISFTNILIYAKLTSCKACCATMSFLITGFMSHGFKTALNSLSKFKNDVGVHSLISSGV